jgi:hypothetical protein
VSGSLKRRLARTALIMILFGVLWPPLMAIFHFCVWLSASVLAPSGTYGDRVQAAMWLPFSVVFSYVLWSIPALCAGAYVAGALGLAFSRRIVAVTSLALGGGAAAIGAGLHGVAGSAVVISSIAGVLSTTALLWLVDWLRGAKSHWLGFGPEAAS